MIRHVRLADLSVCERVRYASTQDADSVSATEPRRQHPLKLLIIHNNGTHLNLQKDSRSVPYRAHSQKHGIASNTEPQQQLTRCSTHKRTPATPPTHTHSTTQLPKSKPGMHTVRYRSHSRTRTSNWHPLWRTGAAAAVRSSTLRRHSIVSQFFF